MLKPSSGSVVGGKYKVVRAIGQGGMGAVYEAEHLLTLRHVALKWVHPQAGCSEHARERLLHEARATSRIRHRNVVEVYDVLQEGDAVCLVMQLLAGEPLSELIAREPLPLHEFVALLLPVMHGVAAAHAAGVVHRDIKPENIILARESGHSGSIPKLIDFGISKVFDPDTPHLTRSGITMGTPKYVSYEQLLGAREVDARTDVYSFGVMLYEAIAGEPPYRASTFGEQAVAFATSVPPPLRLVRPELPAALEELVQQAIAKERSQRVPDMACLLERLEPFADPSAYPTPLLSFPLRDAPRPQGTTVDVGPSPRLGPESALAQAPWSEPSSAPRARPRARPARPVRLSFYGLALAGSLALGLHLLREPVPAPSTAHAAAGDERQAAFDPEREAALSAAAAELRAAAQTAELPRFGADAGSTGESPNPEPEARAHTEQEPPLPPDQRRAPLSASPAQATRGRGPSSDGGRVGLSTSLGARQPRARGSSRPGPVRREQREASLSGVDARSAVDPAPPLEATVSQPPDPLSTHRAGKLLRDEF